MPGFTHRLAIEPDLVTLRRLMARAIEQLQAEYLDRAQIAASHRVMGLDTQLIADRTYFIVEHDGRMAGCGGWSRRATLYGGDHSAPLRDKRLLDPTREPARVRAMYTDPDFARRGVGRMILELCEAAAQRAGFARVELMATLSGEPLYRASGYSPIAPEEARLDGVVVPLVRMEKRLGALA